MNSAAIVGVGLIGASFGLAIRKSGFTGPVLGVSSPSALEAGLAAGAISAAATLEQAAESADLIYLAQPVDRIIDTLRRLGPIVKGPCIITDAGSTKTAIVDAAERYIPHASFIGGHPLAGKETRGAQSADADLFRARPYVLTPRHHAIPEQLSSLLSAIGASCLQMTAEEHDATVALTSHLPQFLSTTLAAYLGNQQEAWSPRVFGSGLLDMTRLALSPADLWASILETNRANVSHALSRYIDALSDARTALDSGDVSPLFKAGAKLAALLRNPDYTSSKLPA